jgi:hypothetical protein
VKSAIERLIGSAAVQEADFDTLRSHPLLPHRDRVRGFVYEVETGRVRDAID